MVGKFEKSAFYYSAIIFIWTFITYLPVLNVGFLSDDFGFFPYFSLSMDEIKRAVELIRSGDQFLSPVRPGGMISFSIDYYLWGLDESKFHLTNIFLHSINAVLIFTLLKRLGMKESSSAFAGLLFGLNPINPEAVVWISGRFDVLALTWLLISMLLWISGWQNGRGIYLAFSAAAFLISVFSKETSVAGILLFPLVDLFIFRISSSSDSIKRRFNGWGYIGLIAPIIATFALRVWLYGEKAGYSEWDGFKSNSGMLAGKLLNTFFMNLWILVSPINREIWVDVASPVKMIIVIIWLIFCVATAAGLFTLLSDRSKENSGRKCIIWFGLILMISTMLPTLPLNFVQESLRASRYLYMPCAGISISAAVSLLAILLKWKKSEILYGAAAVVLIVSTFVLHSNNGAWIEAGRIATDVHRKTEEQVSRITDGTRIVFINLPYVRKGAHLAPNAFDSYLYAMYGIENVETKVIQIIPASIPFWWEGAIKSGDNYVVFVWDESEERIQIIEEFLRHKI